MVLADNLGELDVIMDHSDQRHDGSVTELPRQYEINADSPRKNYDHDADRRHDGSDIHLRDFSQGTGVAGNRSDEGQPDRI